MTDRGGHGQEGEGGWHGLALPRRWPARLSLRAIAHWLADQILEESDRWFLWLPVGFGSGIAFYFALPFEPSLLFVLLAAMALAGAAAVLWSWRRQMALLMLVPAMLLAGFTAAKLRTDLVAAPVVDRQLGPVTVTGWTESFDKRPGGGYRLVLRPENIQRLSAARTPHRMRLTLRRLSGIAPKAGEGVRFRAVLMPPPDAVRPGGFSFARSAWFARIGATGFVVSPLERADLAPMGFSGRVAAMITTWRMHVTHKLRTALPGRGGDVAAALITGVRGGLKPEIRDALRDAGLAHLLAISGMHMAMFGGGLFLLMRWLFALSAHLALHAPIKKWSAVTALAGSAGYLVLSGGSIATQRAFIMTGIMFLAILLDRRAISLRNVALAAMAVLVWRPESLMSVSFQMSFGAVVALIAVYETGLSRGWFYASGGNVFQGVLKAGRYLAGLALTSLIAGAATAPFALYHFHRVAVYGLLGNMLGVPVMGLVIMPSALAALLAMPFGLEAHPLRLMGLGIEAVIGVSSEVAQLPGAVRLVPAFSVTALACIVYGGLFMALWRRQWRYLGLIAIIMGLWLSLMPVRPDVLVDRDGDNIAIRDSAGRLTALEPRKGGYSVQKWLQADGDVRTPGEASTARAAVFACDGQGCIAKLKGGRVLAVVKRRNAVHEDCQIADIVITRIPVRTSRCPAEVLITPKDLHRNGAYAIYLEENGLKTVHAAGLEGDRPWSRSARTHRARRKAKGRRRAARDQKRQ